MPVETYAMVMRLPDPLHAYPASHNRSPEAYPRNPQKGTTALIQNADLNPRRTFATSSKTSLWRTTINMSNEQVRQRGGAVDLLPLCRSLLRRSPILDRPCLQLRHRACGHCSTISQHYRIWFSHVPGKTASSERLSIGHRRAQHSGQLLVL